ncbi:nucleotide triphosphate diphosphatase NUDT15 [Nematostella vectensis]|uniref:nucleotide triphosphate diphosphatase NUDT15 n=1 Tax=Nematostella vectensis TaxID=45351 RepID=UPI0020771E01|nr:nucleotide triphosphate diphosphatase NUDT15 [Nematostella vectensis]
MCSRPGIGVGVFITSRDHPHCVLVGKRKGSTGSGQWATPGGHLEFGEEWDECAARESMEETGLALKNICFATVVNAIVLEEKYHYVTIFMKAEVDSDKGPAEPMNCEPDKCEGWEWFNWDSSSFPSPLFKPLKVARQQNYNPLENV